MDGNCSRSYYLAYYAKTYLGETYSNTVEVSVANYHDLKKVLEDTEHHYYVDNPGVKRNSKIYINDATNGATQLKQFFDLSKGTLNEHVRDCQNLEFFLHTNVNHKGSWTPIGEEGHCFSVVMSITLVSRVHSPPLVLLIQVMVMWRIAGSTPQAHQQVG